jgi:hypothetical protein
MDSKLLLIRDIALIGSLFAPALLSLALWLSGSLNMARRNCQHRRVSAPSIVVGASSIPMAGRYISASFPP